MREIGEDGLVDWNETPAVLGEPRWWLDFISSRLARHSPFPADAEARQLLLYRIAMELFGTPVNEETNAAFVADATPTALESLAKNLVHRPGPDLHAWAGPLTSAPTKFRVLPANPDAAFPPDALQQEAESPRPASPTPEAPKNGNPNAEQPKEGAEAKRQGEGEIVFITRQTQRPFPKLDAGDGATLEIREHVFHGTDVHTSKNA